MYCKQKKNPELQTNIEIEIEKKFEHFIEKLFSYAQYHRDYISKIIKLNY